MGARDLRSEINAVWSTAGDNFVYFQKNALRVLYDDAYFVAYLLNRCCILQVQNLTELVKKPTIKTVFDNTQDTTPGRKYSKMLEGLTAR